MKNSSKLLNLSKVLQNTLKRLLPAVFSVLLIVSSAYAGGKKESKSTVTESEKTEVFSENEVIEDSSSLETEVEQTEQLAQDSSEKTSKDENSITVGTLNGVFTIPSVYLLDNPSAIEGYTVNLSVEAENVLAEKIAANDLNIAFVPLDTAARIYNNFGGSVKVFAVICNGNFYVLSRDTEVISFENLKGKTVSVTEKDSIMDCVFRYLLNCNNINSGSDENSVNIDYSVTDAKAAQALLSGKSDYVLVGEPYLTSVIKKDSSVEKVLNLQDEYAVFSEIVKAPFPYYTAIVNSSFAENSSEILSAFSTVLKQAVEWTRQNPQKAGVSYQKHKLGFAAPVIGSSIQGCNFTYEEAVKDEKQINELLNIMLEYSAEAIGGKAPDSGFILGTQ